MTQSLTNAKTPVAKVVIDYSEADGREVTLTGREFPSLEAFDAAIAKVKEPSLGYYKTGFTILFVDGAKYQGRYDIGSDSPTLRQHVRSFCQTYSGRVKPGHMTDKQWLDFKHIYHDNAPTFGRFLDNYQL